MTGAVVACIPARGGSKGVPGKNLRKVGGKSLIELAIGCATGAASIDHIVVSTDDPGIAEEAERCGVPVPALRPAELATDETPMIDVLAHVLETLRREGPEPDCIVLLQPTSPLRTAAMVESALAAFRVADADTLVSVVDVPHRYSPEKLMTEQNGLLLSSDTAISRRQDGRRFVARNGPAILIVRPARIDEGSLYGGRTIPFKMTQSASVDIDTEDDLVLAACLFDSRNAGC